MRSLKSELEHWFSVAVRNTVNIRIEDYHARPLFCRPITKLYTVWTHSMNSIQCESEHIAKLCIRSNTSGWFCVVLCNIFSAPPKGTFMHVSLHSAMVVQGLPLQSHLLRTIERGSFSHLWNELYVYDFSVCRKTGCVSTQPCYMTAVAASTLISDLLSLNFPNNVT